jgi:hypothetical protein
MGLGPSKPENNEQKFESQVYNAKHLISDDEGVATTLGGDDLYTDMPTKSKPTLPTFGTNKYKGDSTNAFLGGSAPYERESNKNRYQQFDIFDMLNKYEQENDMRGGSVPAPQPVASAPKTGVDNTSDEALERVRQTIISKLKDLEVNKVGGGSCGCENNVISNKSTGGAHMLATGPQKKLYRDDSSTSTTTSTSSESTSSSHTSSSEFGKKKKGSKKSKKTTKFDIESSSDNFIIDTTESGKESRDEPDARSRRTRRGRRERRDTNNTSNGEESESAEETEEGLSIFPFNSSDVKSSASSQNFKTLRRKV